MFRFSKDIKLSGYTFVITSVSVGNVGQLANDLLIISLNLTKVATAWHKAIIPAFGPNPFDEKSDDNCVACELYVSEKLKLLVMQLRSSIDRRYVDNFLDDLATFIRNESFAHVLILASTFAYEQHNVLSGHYRYVTNTDLGPKFEKGNVLPLEPASDGGMKIYGSGFATKLYQLLADNSYVSILLKYTSEGDNRPDAISMLRVLYSCFGLKQELIDQIQSPASWDLVYGNPPPIGIY